MLLSLFYFLIFIGYDVDVYDKLSQPGGRAQTWTTEWISPKVILKNFPVLSLRETLRYTILSYLLPYINSYFNTSLG